MDAQVLADPNASRWEKGVAGASLGANVVTDGLLPNAGGFIKNCKKLKNLEKNKEAGKAFEKATHEALQQTDKEVVEQLTLKTKSGVKTKMDHVSKDAQTGEIKLTESKASETAPLTDNQKVAHPEIEQSGATIVGKGKPGYPGGTVIPPTKVNVVRPQN